MSCVGRLQDARPGACQRGSQLKAWRNYWNDTLGLYFVKWRSDGF
jgi:hypothetical protein